MSKKMAKTVYERELRVDISENDCDAKCSVLYHLVATKFDIL